MQYEQRDNDDKYRTTDDDGLMQPPSVLRPGQQQELSQNQARPSGLDIPEDNLADLDLPGGDMDQPIAINPDDVVPCQNDDEEDFRSRDMDEPLGPPEESTDVDRLGDEPTLRRSQNDSGMARAEAKAGEETWHNAEDDGALRPAEDLDPVRTPYQSDELTQRREQDLDLTIAPPTGDRAVDPKHVREADAEPTTKAKLM
jgi:hypothetical protein